MSHAFDKLLAIPYISALMDFQSELARTLREKLQPKEASTKDSPLVASADSSTYEQAAVVLILRENRGEIELLLIKRAEHPCDPWSGHIAFPGGRADPSDTSLRATAVRETREEVGIDLETEGEILGQLEPLCPRNPRLPRIMVTPLVALARPDIRLKPGSEVKEAFWLPLNRLRERGRSDTVEKLSGQNWHTWPAYPSPHGPIWGLTERILTRFLSLCG